LKTWDPTRITVPREAALRPTRDLSSPDGVPVATRTGLPRPRWMAVGRSNESGRSSALGRSVGGLRSLSLDLCLAGEDVPFAEIYSTLRAE